MARYQSWHKLLNEDQTELAEQIIKEFNDSNAYQNEDILLVERLSKFLNRVQIANAIVCMSDTCKHCKNRDTTGMNSCSCWNDE